MHWFEKQAEGGAEENAPFRAPRVDFSSRILESKFQRLSQLAEAAQGVEYLVDALRAKQALCAQTLGADGLDSANRESLLIVMQSMFTARRKFAGPFMALEDAGRRRLLESLLRGAGPAHERMQAFVDGSPAGHNRKVRRAAWDFAAECLHFTDPERYPLMARWVWDAATETGALREFVAGSDSMVAVPIAADTGGFEASRRWFAGQLSGLGCYRDLHFVIDLVLAQAYGDYMQAISFNVGLGSGELGGKSDPLAFPKRLMGIDGGPRGPARRN